MRDYREIVNGLEEQGYVVDNIIGLVEVIQNTIMYAPDDKKGCIGALEILQNTLVEHSEKMDDIRQKVKNESKVVIHLDSIAE